MSATSMSLSDPAAGWVPGARSWVSRAQGCRAWPAGGRVSYLVVGVLLVVAGAAGVLITVAQVRQRDPVLVLARPVVVGQVLAPGDLRAVEVSADPGVDVVVADRTREVVGRPVGYSLPAGTLLSRAVLGAPQTPPPGQGVAAVAAEPGQFPPQLTAGTTVSIIQNTGTGAGASTGSVSGGPWTAVVTGIAPTAGDQVAVISLQLPAQDARQVAAIPSGRLSIVTEAAGDR